jgi:hypothetical protein
VLLGGLIGVVIVVAVVVAVVVRTRTRDDEHSVEHYHRQLHTLEEIRSHPAPDPDNGNGSAHEDATYPARAFRVSGSSTVRLTEPGRPIVPPVPPPPLANPGRPISFGDEDENKDEHEHAAADGGEKAGDHGGANGDEAPATFMSGKDDRAMHGINHRPRRLAGPAAAVAAVLVLIVVLILTGLHESSPPHHGTSANTPTTAATRHHPPRTGTRHQATTTSTTAAPAVSAPQGATAHAATYQVANASYSLALAANGGECWVEATSASGSVLFTATLFSGQSHTIAATGPVTVIAGAPGAFVATIDGAAVALPPGNQAPFTLHFTPATTPA